MTIGTLEIRIVIHSSFSLKDKRRVVKSMKDRLRNRFNVSVAEVGSQNDRKQAILGVAMVGTDQPYLDGALNHVLRFVRAVPEADLVDFELSFF